MKDSTMILVLAAILAAAALPALGRSLQQMVKATETIEQVRASKQVSPGYRVIANRGSRHLMKGWLSL